MKDPMMALYAIETRLLQLPSDALVPDGWVLDSIGDEWIGIQCDGAGESTRPAPRELDPQGKSTSFLPTL